MFASKPDPARLRDVLVLPDLYGAYDLTKVVEAQHADAPEAIALGLFTWIVASPMWRYRWLAPYHIADVRTDGFLARLATALNPDLALLVLPPGGTFEVGDLRAIREAGVERLVLLAEDDGDDGALAAYARGQAREAGFEDEAAPIVSMRLRRALRHVDRAHAEEELGDEDLDEFEPGCFEFSELHLDRCLGWVGELKAALDALPVLRTRAPGAWPTFAPSARFACAVCGVVLTPPLAEARLVVTGRHQVVRGMYFTIAREKPRMPVGHIVVHWEDLQGVRFSADTQGFGGYLCPGELPNLECPNGHRFGYGFAGGVPPDIIMLDPALVHRLPPR